jgi:hypothetical protein
MRLLSWLPFGLFIAPSPRATEELIHHLLPQDREQKADWIAKGALMAFIYFGGILHYDQRYNE